MDSMRARINDSSTAESLATQNAMTEATRLGMIDRWDSLSVVFLGICLERRLGRPIDVTAWAGVTSVGGILETLCDVTEPRR